MLFLSLGINKAIYDNASTITQCDLGYQAHPRHHGRHLFRSFVAPFKRYNNAVSSHLGPSIKIYK